MGHPQTRVPASNTDRTPVLVVTDLDGTLWDASELAHHRTLRALRTLQERQFPVLVATGRTLHSAHDLLARNSLQLPILSLDGALGQDFDGQSTFHQVAFAPDAARAVLELLQAAQLQPFLHINHPLADTVIEADIDLVSRHGAFYSATLRRASLTQTVDEEPVYQFVSYGPPKTLEVVAATASRYGACTIIQNALLGGSALTVSPPAASKWAGTKRFCELHNLDARRVLAVGNGENDLELLRGAAVACVVRDGRPEALALADHVIDPAMSGGWAEVLNLIWPKSRQ